MSKLQHIQQVLFYPTPSGIISNSTIGNSIHQKVLKESFTGRRNAIINLYAWLSWYLFFGWLRVIRIWKRRKEVVFDQDGISPKKQLNQLLSLAFKHGIHPVSYYQLKLYKYPPSEWMNFLFVQELPELHRLLSPKLTERTKRKLKFKGFFAEEMSKKGVGVIEGKVLKKGSLVQNSDLFNKKSVFIKPVAGSGQKDNFSLIFEEGDYLLAGDELRIKSQTEILELLNEKVKSASFLVQPLCQNHLDFKGLSTSTDLITIRLITVNREQNIHVVSALLEIPLEDHRRVYCVEPIDLINGRVKLSDNAIRHEKMKSIDFQMLDNFKVPMWEEVCANAILAHEQMKEVYSIGWDLAITNQGVKIIEGNFNWNVVPHQMNGPGLFDLLIG